MRIAGRAWREIRSRRRLADLQHPAKSPPHLRIIPNLNKLVNPLDYLRPRTREGVVLLNNAIASAVIWARGARDLVLGEPHIHV